jgi:hypothetical protein
LTNAPDRASPHNLPDWRYAYRIRRLAPADVDLLRAPKGELSMMNETP